MRGSRLAFVCTGASLVLAPIASAQDPYRDFRIPEVRSFSWTLRTSAQWHASEVGEPDIHELTRSRSGDLRSDLHRHSESERQLSDIRSTASGSWNWRLSRDVYEGQQSLFQSRFDEDSYALFLGTSWTRFLGETNWGIEATLDASYDFRRDAISRLQTRITGTLDDREGAGSERREYFGTGDAALGLGYGRVRDVTGVFDAQVVAQRLAATGRLLHPVSHGALEKLAQLFSVGSGFREAHDRPTRYFWREVERILREDGALLDETFDAYSLLRALEPATLSVRFARAAGWRVSTLYSAGRAWGHTDFDNRQGRLVIVNGNPVSTFGEEFHGRFRENRRSSQLLVDVRFDRPMGMRRQVSLGSTLRYHPGMQRAGTASSAVQLDQLVADRWVVSTTLTQDVTSVRAGKARLHPDWNVKVFVEGAYFVEDSWALFADYQHAQSRRPEYPYFGPSESRFDRANDFRVGLTYRPVGRFEAPGLGVSERLTRLPL